MTSGGARGRSGPAPDPKSLRSLTRDWITLPAEGFQGDVPAWPLSGQSEREVEVWQAHWRMPQAVRWSAEQMTWNVAFYVRRFAEAEESGSAANLSTLVKQLAEDLGLSKAGMDRNRWRIADAPALALVGAADAKVVPIESGSSRDRFKTP